MTEMVLRGSGKLQKVLNQTIDPIKFARDRPLEFLQKIGLVHLPGEQLDKGFDSGKRISNFMGHTRSQSAQSCQSLCLPNTHFETL